MALTNGTKLGPYEIVSPLGAGGMGEVYRARDTRLGRDVAVKVLPASLASDRELLWRFEQEARAVGTLDHPNILAIHDLGTHEETPYLVTELLEGQTLRDRMSGSTLPLRKAVDIAVQTANGVAAAHAKGTVHRDLKPENLFITADGRVKILDFGLAKLAEPPADAGETLARTQPGSVLGTVGYMSPEQVRGREADSRSDIFSIGAILYEMVTGRRPFTGDSAVETMSAILKEDPPEISTIQKGVPPAVERVIRRCLEKSGEERFQSARDLAFALEAVSDSSSLAAFPVSPEAARVARRRNRLIPVAEAVLLLLAGAAAFWLVQGRSQRRAGPISYREVSFQPQMVFSAAFARDGRAIVYSAAREGNRPELYVIRPESPAPQPLGLRDTNLLSVSSKGDLAVLVHARYLFHRIFSGTLATMPLVGGAPREILEDVRQADWAADGASLAVIRGIGGKDRLEFPAGKLLYETSGWLSDLRISPGGDRIAFFEHPIRFDDRGSVAMVDLAGKKTTLSSGYSAERGIAWAPDGREVFFTAKDTAQPHIYGVSLAGERRVALEGAGWLTIHDIARNGEWLLTRDEIRADLLVLAPGERRERNVSWMDFSARPLLSADGRTLVFTEENGAIGLNYMSCVQKPPGSAVVQLGEGFAYDLSADGKWAAVIVPSTPQLFKLYPIGPGEPRTLERGNIESYATVQWFADQKRALVCGNEPGHATRCYVQEIAGGPPRKVTPEGTSDGLPSPDGRFVLIQNSAGEHMLYPLEGGEPRAVKSVAATDRLIRWSPDGHSLFVYGATEVPTRVERVDLASGRRELFRILSPRSWPAFWVSWEFRCPTTENPTPMPIAASCPRSSWWRARDECDGRLKGVQEARSDRPDTLALPSECPVNRPEALPDTRCV